MDEENKRMSKKTKLFLFFVLVSVVSFAYRPNRERLCQNAYICIKSCKEYSGKPVHARLNHMYEKLSCEEEEANIKRGAYLKIRSIIGFPQSSNPLGLKPMELKESLDLKNEKTGGHHE